MTWPACTHIPEMCNRNRAYKIYGSESNEGLGPLGVKAFDDF